MVVAQTAQLVGCHGLCCATGRAGASGRAGPRGVVSIGMIAAGRGAPVPRVMHCVLCREDQAQASPQYLRCGGSQTWNVLSCIVTL